MVAQARRTNAGRPLRVLLVEDSEEDVSLLLRRLRRGGYEPEYRRVESRGEMKVALAAAEWDVILSDYGTRRFGWSEALGLAREAGSDAPFIFVSDRIGEEFAVETVKAGAYDYVMKDNLIRLCGTVEHGLEEARHRRERRRAETELRRRDAILEAVRFAADRLLGETIGWEENVRVVLRRLGEATGASRVYVTENYTGADGELWNRECHKWVASGNLDLSDDPSVTDQPYRVAGFGRWMETLGRGEPIFGRTRTFPMGEQPLLVESRSIQSIALVPIFVEGLWCGFIGFDECSTEREWSAAEVGALGAAAGTLGAAIRRKRLDEELRASEAEMRAVFGAMNDVILVLNGEGRYLKVAPTTFSWLYRPPEVLVGKTVYDTFPREQADRILSAIRRALETQGRVDIEYGLLVGTEEMWFDATITPMTEDSVVAVARDTTERARMQRSLEERVANLSRISAQLTLDRPTGSTLDTLAESVVGASTAVACSVALVEEADTVVVAGSHGLPEGYVEGLQAAYDAGVTSPTVKAFRRGRSTLVRDVRRFVLEDPLYAPIHRFVREAPWDSALFVPLIFQGKTLGGINLAYLPGQEPGEDEQVFLRTVADQAAVVVENARLFSEVRGKAALQERQRLARELHDSVSQTLYGIALTAKAVRRELDDGPAEIVEPLDYVLSLAETGMVEMRALIFELRPESLESEGLVAALGKQGAALGARHGLAVKTDLCDEPEMSLETKEAIYRIAQEALNNAVKHARATDVKLSLNCDPERIVLQISDDGIGFDPSDGFPGHLGLRSMRERAEHLGGVLEVHSAPGKGTRVRACIGANAASGSQLSR